MKQITASFINPVTEVMVVVGKPIALLYTEAQGLSVVLESELGAEPIPAYRVKIVAMWTAFGDDWTYVGSTVVHQGSLEYLVALVAQRA